MCRESGMHGVDWGKSKVSVKGTRGVRDLEVTASNGKTETYLSIYAVLNIRNPLMIEYITMMQREGRKAFVGTTLATQLLRALIPENKESEAAESLKGVFELCQYRFYFYFPPTSIDLLEQASAGELTQSQIRKIGKFKQGRCLLSIAGGENYEFKVDITAKQNNLFKGGGKNAA